MEHQHFLYIFTEILNKYAPIKQKESCHKRFMTKDLSKSIMKRSRLRNKSDGQDRNISKKI